LLVVGRVTDVCLAKLVQRPFVPPTGVAQNKPELEDLDYFAAMAKATAQEFTPI